MVHWLFILVGFAFGFFAGACAILWVGNIRTGGGSNDEGDR